MHYICEGVLHQKEEAMKITTKQITTTAVLLAICIVSQFFKNTSVYITGPVINACLILAVLSVGIPCGIILSVITPVTSFFITGSPIIGAIPAIMPCIMAGNAILVLGVGLVTKKCKGNGGLIAGMAAGSVVKALFMGIVISLILIPNLLPAPMEAKMAVFQTTFFRDAACDFPDRKRVCIYSLDSVEKSGKIGKKRLRWRAGEKILLRVFCVIGNFVPITQKYTAGIRTSR